MDVHIDTRKTGQGLYELMLNSSTSDHSCLRFSSYPRIFEATMTLGYLSLFLRFIQCYKEMLASVYSNNSVHVWGSEEYRLLLTFLDPWIIKMPLAMHSSRKLFLVLHLAPTFHIGSAGSDHLWKVQIRCFPHKHLFPVSSPALAAPDFSKSACSIKTKPNKEL